MINVVLVVGLPSRKNAGVLLRRMSDDFDARKFPELIEGVKARRRTRSLGDAAAESAEEPKPNGAPSKMIRYLRRLSSGAITPSDPKLRSLTAVSQQPPLTESTEEDETDTTQENQ